MSNLLHLYTFILVFCMLACMAGSCSPGIPTPATANTPTLLLPTNHLERTPTAPFRLTQSSPTDSAPAEPSAGNQPTPLGTYEARLVSTAREDLAKRLGIEQEAIEFISFRIMVWPDGSLGCPQPGVAYTQVQQEGYQIQLKVGEKTYAYHGGESRSLFLCEKNIPSP